MREIYGRGRDDPVDDLDVNMDIWRIFLNATLQTAVHLEQDDEAHLRYVKNHLWSSVKQLVNETGTLIRGQTEITGVNKIDFEELRGCRQAYRAAKLISTPTPKPTSSRTLYSVRWKWEMILLRPGREKLNGIRETITSKKWIESTACRRSSREKYSQESQRWPPREDSKSNERRTVWTWALQRQDHLHVNVQRHWMGRKRKSRNMWTQFTDGCELCSKVPSRSLVFLGAWIRKEVVRNLHWQTRRVLASGHPVVRASSAFERGELKSKGGGKKSIHFNGSGENVELLLRTAISANQLSVYGAVADLCRELSKDTTASGKPQAHDPLETMKMPIEPPTADPRTDEQRRGNLLQQYEQKFEQQSDNQKLSKLCSDGSLKTVERGQYFITLDTTQGLSGMVHLCREYTLPRNDPRTRARGWIRGNTKIGPVLNIHVCHHEDRYCTEIQVSASRQNHLLSSNCEWTWKERNRDDRNHWRWREWSFRETYCHSKTTNEVYSNADTRLCSSTWMKVDGQQSWRLWSEVQRGIKSNDVIATTWSNNSSKLTEQWYFMII